MRHNEWQALIPDYVARTLTRTETQAFEAHLADCEDCQKELKQWLLIADATWQVTHQKAQKLPALPIAFYKQLGEIPRQSSHLVTHNGAMAQPTVPYQVPRYPRQKRPAKTLQFPRFLNRSLVAVAVMAFMFVGVGIFTLGYNLVTRQDTNGEVIQLTPQIENPDGTAIAFLSAPSATPTVPPTKQAQIILPPVTSDNSDVQADVGSTSIVIAQPTLAPTLTLTPEATFPPPPTRTSNEAESASTFDEGVGGSGGAGGGTERSSSQPLQSCRVYNHTQRAISIYQGAGRNFAIVGQIAAGQRANITVTDGKGWYQLLYRQWVSSEDVTLEGDCGAVWIATPTVTFQNQPMATPTSSFIMPTAMAGAIIAGDWLHRAEVVGHSCGGSADEVNEFHLIIEPSRDESTVTFTYLDTETSFTLERIEPRMYSGSYETESALIEIELGFKAANLYNAIETVTHHNGCTVSSLWSGKVVLD